MSAVIIDTHAIVWYFLKSGNLSANALVEIERAESVYVASISVVEIIYLNEKGKLPAVALERLIQALGDINTGWLVVPLSLEISQALAQIPRNVVPDMPDRIITATAFYLNLPLVSCDSKIQAANIQTIW
ncbi:type II toxin-antitoxin system VapC family toxin [Microcoleus sp. herbarium19]|uniref:type II toxin-antitoxin system VapC family toxin n=1 Tax=unclassified Microcoleus TaxID=2642155 RepID=UPI002FCECCBD